MSPTPAWWLRSGREPSSGRSAGLCGSSSKFGLPDPRWRGGSGVLRSTGWSCLSGRALAAVLAGGFDLPAQAGTEDDLANVGNLRALPDHALNDARRGVRRDWMPGPVPRAQTAGLLGAASSAAGSPQHATHPPAAGFPIEALSSKPSGHARARSRGPPFELGLRSRGRTPDRRCFASGDGGRAQGGRHASRHRAATGPHLAPVAPRVSARGTRARSQEGDARTGGRRVTPRPGGSPSPVLAHSHER